MGEHYKHLSLEERCQIRGMIEQNLSISAIAKKLRRDRRTIQRELARNRSKTVGHKPDTAHRFSRARKFRGSKIARCSHLQNHGTSALAMGWTPEQIAGRLHLTATSTVMSHEPIYRYIYSPEGRRQKLSKYLPYHHARRGYRRRKGTRQPPVPNRIPIMDRPETANDRSALGHWEGDLVHFSHKGDVMNVL